MGNLNLTNPSEPPETLKAIVTAILEDEALLANAATSASVTALASTVTTQGGQITTQGNEITALQGAAAYALYTVAGAIAPAGRAVLKTGTAGHMTLVAPAADNILLIIVAADAEAYVVTCGTAGKLNGGTAGTFGGAIGDSLILLSSGGVWLAVLANGVTIA